MEKLINYILRYIPLNEEQIGFLNSKAKRLHLRKGDFFSKAGKTSREVGFILDGVLRVSHCDNDGKDLTFAFIEENHLVVDLASFNTQTPSSVSIQAVTDCELIALGGELLKTNTTPTIPWDLFFNKIMTEAFYEKARKGSVMLTEDAKTRYLTFLQEHPNLANRVPLSTLATYLGITQSSLSRIRKSIS